jgi:hypothetical protein
MKPGVIVDVAGEIGREGERRDVEAARLHEAGALLEPIDGPIDVELRVARQGADLAGGGIGVAADREIAPQRRPRLVAQAGAIRRARKKALSDLTRGAAADARDAGDGDDVLDEGLGGLGRLALDGGEKTGVLGRAVVRRGLRDAVESAAGDDGAQDAALGCRADPKRFHDGVEKPDVAEPDREVRATDDGEALEGERQDLGVGGRSVGAPDRLEPGLEELPGLADAQAGRPARVGIGGRTRPGGGEMLAAHRDRVLGPQAQLLPCGVLRDEHAPAHVLARELEEHVGALQDRRLDPRVAVALEEREEGVARLCWSA